MNKSKFRTFLETAICVLAIFASAAIVSAAPPPNDNLANAQTISGASGSVPATTLEATREESEPAHTFSGVDRVFKTVWFQWTAPQTGPVALTATSATTDVAAALLIGNSYPIETLTLNNDAVGTDTRIEFAAVSGTTYKFVVGVYDDDVSPGGPFTLQWTQNAAPSNNDFGSATQLSGRSGSLAMTNLNATSEPSEPLFGSGKTIWFRYTNNQPSDYSLTFTTESSFDGSFDTNLALYTGSSLASLAPVVKNDFVSGTLKSRVTFLARSGVTYYLALDSGSNPAAGDAILDWFVTKQLHYTDFGTRDEVTKEVNYDFCADIAVVRPSTGVWYWLNSFNGTFNAFQFGLPGDKAIPADFDGDGRTDLAVTRNVGGAKVWHVRNSFDGSHISIQWGLASDREIPGDFDNDGRADIAVFRPSNNVWYVLRSSDGQYFIKEFGLAGDIPVLGDFKGTPAGDDLAVFRPSAGTWFIFDGTNTIYAPFGSTGDKPVPADYDADGKTDLAVFRPSTGVWYWLTSKYNLFQYAQWGLATDIPMPGDFDRFTNDPADPVVFRPSDNTWYILRSEGNVINYTNFGATGDIPVSSFVP